MSLNTQIQTIVETLYPDATYELSSRFQGNIDSYSLESSELPLTILDNELSKDNEIQINNNVLKNHRVLISILKLDDPNNTIAQSEAIRAECEGYADAIAVKIYQLEEVRLKPVSSRQKYKVTPLFHVFNTDLSGVALEMFVNYNTVVNF